MIVFCRSRYSASDNASLSRNEIDHKCSKDLCESLRSGDSLASNAHDRLRSVNCSIH